MSTCVLLPLLISSVGFFFCGKDSYVRLSEANIFERDYRERNRFGEWDRKIVNLVCYTITRRISK